MLYFLILFLLVTTNDNVVLNAKKLLQVCFAYSVAYYLPACQDCGLLLGHPVLM